MYLVLLAGDPPRPMQISLSRSLTETNRPEALHHTPDTILWASRNPCFLSLSLTFHASHHSYGQSICLSIVRESGYVVVPDFGSPWPEPSNRNKTPNTPPWSLILDSGDTFVFVRTAYSYQSLLRLRPDICLSGSQTL
jgi:hypothetical protein